MDFIRKPYDKVHAVSLLRSQHREIERLFSEFEDHHHRSPSKRQMLLEEIAILFDSHSRLEEEIIYPLAMEVDSALVLESLEEHEIIMELLLKIAQTEPDAKSFYARISVLKALMKNHIKSEERDLFPRLESSLGLDQLLKLGTALKNVHFKMTGEALNASRERFKVSDHNVERRKFKFLTGRSSCEIHNDRGRSDLRVGTHQLDSDPI